MTGVKKQHQTLPTYTTTINQCWMKTVPGPLLGTIPSPTLAPSRYWRPLTSLLAAPPLRSLYHWPRVLPRLCIHRHEENTQAKNRALGHNRAPAHGLGWAGEALQVSCNGRARSPCG